MMVPAVRIRRLNNVEVNASGEYALYWMTAFRRMRWNFSLQRACEWSRKLAKPLIILEALRCDYPWASDRLHGFVIEGMIGNGAYCAGANALYYPYLEATKGAGKGLLAAFAEKAAVVIADDYPCFFLPAMLNKAGAQLRTCLEAVDSNGLLPISQPDYIFTTAIALRRYLQKDFGREFPTFPEADPLSALTDTKPAKPPAQVIRRWPPADLERSLESLASFPIDHGVATASTRGGMQEAGKRLASFLRSKVEHYDELRNHPDEDHGSGLSPYLHFGHISVHEIFHKLAEEEDWTPQRLAKTAAGKKSGWWGMRLGAEAFLDEVITWRELGFNMCRYDKDYDKFESLPAWARQTLRDHESDPREHVYTLEEFEQAQTSDPLWNAAQRELLEDGRIHNYLRMLWGKKILEWTRSPQEALDVMLELNNKYALDGRDPNSYTGIFWILGRYDRAWGPERKIFGKVRYMSSANTMRKLRLGDYLARWGK